MRLTRAEPYAPQAPVPKLPSGLVELMEGLTRDVLRNNPQDVYEFCAGHMQKLLEIRDGRAPGGPLSLSQKMKKVQEVVRERAEERRKKYDEKMKPRGNQNLDEVSVVTDDSTTIPTLKAPVHHEDELREAIEVEIFHKPVNEELSSHDNIKLIINEVHQNEDIITANETKGDDVQTSHEHIREIRNVNSDGIDSRANGIQKCKDTKNKVSTEDIVTTDDSVDSPQNKMENIVHAVSAIKNIVGAINAVGSTETVIPSKIEGADVCKDSRVKAGGNDGCEVMEIDIEKIPSTKNMSGVNVSNEICVTGNEDVLTLEGTDITIATSETIHDNSYPENDMASIVHAVNAIKNKTANAVDTQDNNNVIDEDNLSSATDNNKATIENKIENIVLAVNAIKNIYDGKNEVNDANSGGHYITEKTKDNTTTTDNKMENIVLAVNAIKNVSASNTEINEVSKEQPSTEKILDNAIPTINKMENIVLAANAMKNISASNTEVNTLLSEEQPSTEKILVDTIPNVNKMENIVLAANVIKNISAINTEVNTLVSEEQSSTEKILVDTIPIVNKMENIVLAANVIKNISTSNTEVNAPVSKEQSSTEKTLVNTIPTDNKTGNVTSDVNFIKNITTNDENSFLSAHTDITLTEKVTDIANNKDHVEKLENIVFAVNSIKNISANNGIEIKESASSERELDVHELILAENKVDNVPESAIKYMTDCGAIESTPGTKELVATECLTAANVPIENKMENIVFAVNAIKNISANSGTVSGSDNKDLTSFENASDVSNTIVVVGNKMENIELVVNANATTNFDKLNDPDTCNITNSDNVTEDSNAGNKMQNIVFAVSAIKNVTANSGTDNDSENKEMASTKKAFDASSEEAVDKNKSDSVIFTESYINSPAEKSEDLVNMDRVNVENMLHDTLTKTNVTTPDIVINDTEFTDNVIDDINVTVKTKNDTNTTHVDNISNQIDSETTSDHQKTNIMLEVEKVDVSEDYGNKAKHADMTKETHESAPKSKSTNDENKSDRVQIDESSKHSDGIKPNEHGIDIKAAFNESTIIIPKINSEQYIDTNITENVLDSNLKSSDESIKLENLVTEDYRQQDPMSIEYIKLAEQDHKSLIQTGSTHEISKNFVEVTQPIPARNEAICPIHIEQKNDETRHHDTAKTECISLQKSLESVGNDSILTANSDTGSTTETKLIIEEAGEVENNAGVEILSENKANDVNGEHIPCQNINGDNEVGTESDKSDTDNAKTSDQVESIQDQDNIYDILNNSNISETLPGTEANSVGKSSSMDDSTIDDINDSVSEPENKTKPHSPSNMDLETAAVTIQKVFRNFMFKSRSSTFDDTANDDTILTDDADEDKEEVDFPIPPTSINKERRTLGINRMESVLQTVNEEKSLSLSTDDSSLSSAATTIQAHVRGFLVRSRLNSNRTSSFTSLERMSTSYDDVDQKNKTVLNIHIVSDGGHFMSRDESMITSMDLSLDDSPPSSVNLHPLGYDKSEPRKQLKREDAIQSISPPSNNSGKLSEDSVKDISINGSTLEDSKVTESALLIEPHETGDQDSRETTPTKSTTIETVVEAHKLITDYSSSSELEREVAGAVKQGTLSKMSSDESDVVTPFVPCDGKNSASSDDTSKLLHSGEFHDILLPTKVSRSETSVVRGE